DGGFEIGDDDFMRLALTDLELLGAFGPEEYDVVKSFNFMSVFLRALAQEGFLAIRAAPRVMARSGQKAQIRIGRETFFGVQSEKGRDIFVRQEIRQVDTGISLDIEPVVRGNNVMVKLDRAEVSDEVR